MLKKIILPLVLLIFTQQEFYGMEEEEEKKGENENSDIKEQYDFWLGVDNYMNVPVDDKLSYLWTIFDNIPFQYGGSKIWKHGEAYYGLSNGIGFFPSALNFGWMKVGIVDAHINVINTIIKYMKTYTAIKYDYYYTVDCILKNKYAVQHKNPVWLNSFKWWLFYTVVTDIHLFSFKFFNCVKIKIISLGAIVTYEIKDDLLNSYKKHWYFYFSFYDDKLVVPKNYFIFSPRIEINIPELITYFNGK